MSRPEAIAPAVYEDGSRPQSPRPLLSVDGAAPDPVPKRPQLFLAWSEGHPRIGEWGAAEVPGAPDKAQTRDRGLWLLRGTRVRQEEWLRLASPQEDSRTAFGAAASPAYAAAKRAFDLAVAALALILTMPLLLLVAMVVRLDSAGPVLFRQRRIGRDGAEFLLWKFRSMYADASAYASSPSSDADPRLTRVGRLIRRASIDELPQLINVLRGEMSLVGPRPEMPFIVETYTTLERQRLAVKPGITGLWQVSPARAMPIHENVRYDLHYIRHRNLALDGAILLRTVAAVVHGVGAV
jgi:lipopolysaccharide/colanic/teichoic acid biosynthesis glycosyltransferase